MNAIIMIQSGTLKIGEKHTGLVNTIKKPLICRLFYKFSYEIFKF